jgi:hypothetical protein
MDVGAVSQAIAALVASGAGKERVKDAGRGLVAAVVDRVRQVFGEASRGCRLGSGCRRAAQESRSAGSA